MWFKNAYQSEKIKYMFNNELSLKNVYFDNFLFYDIKTLRLTFVCGNLPETLPEKWEKDTFNSLSVRLIFTEINMLKISCRRVGFICTPNIDKENNEILFSIKNDDNNFVFSANFMFIDEILPVKDDRFS